VVASAALAMGGQVLAGAVGSQIDKSVGKMEPQVAARQVAGGPCAPAIINSGKLDYLFGDVRSSAHNAARSAQNLREMSRLGLIPSAHGRALIENHLQSVVSDSRNIAGEYSNVYGTFQVRESLFAGPSGAFSKLESTWQVMPDGSLRLITVIPYGGG
jgi:hypothetical protein